LARDSSRDHQLGGQLDPLPIIIPTKPEHEVVEPHMQKDILQNSRVKCSKLCNWVSP
jgi:hypothetical protein